MSKITLGTRVMFTSAVVRQQALGDPLGIIPTAAKACLLLQPAGSIDEDTARVGPAFAHRAGTGHVDLEDHIVAFRRRG